MPFHKYDGESGLQIALRRVVGFLFASRRQGAFGRRKRIGDRRKWGLGRYAWRDTEPHRPVRLNGSLRTSSLKGQEGRFTRACLSG